jgi:predicted transcriptional regulator
VTAIVPRLCRKKQRRCRSARGPDCNSAPRAQRPRHEPATVAEALTPAVPIRRSVQHDRVVCLECGFCGQMLRRHLREDAFDPGQYRARWKLPFDHPITAPGYSERRSTMAKQIGLGRKAEVPRPIPDVAAAVAPAPKRRGRKPRSACGVARARRPEEAREKPSGSGLYPAVPT